MTTKTKTPRAVLSGFCNAANPPDSHGRCRKHDCPCFCHWKADPVTVTTDAGARTGFHPDIPEPEYHADRTTLSVSGAKILLKAPELFRWEQDNRVYKDVFDFGSAAHRMVLGVGAELVVHKPKDGVKSPKSTTAWKEEQEACRARDAVLLLPAEYVTVQKMALQLERHKTALELLSGDGTAEVSGYAVDPDTGVAMRCRFDYLTDTYGVDYKSTASAHPDAFSKSCANLGYDMQEDWYRYVAELNDQPLEAFHFIAQEKEPPYIVEVYTLNGDFQARGRARNERARDIYVRCTEADDWTGGYTGQPFSTLAPPAWTRYESASITRQAGIPADFSWSLDDYS